MRRATPGALALLFGCVALGGCATRADLLQVQQDQHEVRALLADQQVAVDGLRRRIDMLRSEVGDRGAHGGPLPTQLQARLDDLEARVAAMEQPHVVVTPVPVQPPTTAPPPGGERPGEVRPGILPTPPGPRPAAGGGDEEPPGTDPEFRAAAQQVRQGQCDQAVPRLRDYIRKNAKSETADNAQYLIGSCYYNQRDYNRAIIELNEVLLKYPRGDKVPAALLMLADAFADSGDKIDARLILQKLIGDHPRSEEAERGRQKLQTLGE